MENYPNGAGFLFVCTSDNTALLLLRSNAVKESGTWGIPGGGLKSGETFPEAAQRETVEEIGVMPKGRFIDKLENTRGDWKYEIFMVDLSLTEKLALSSRIKLNNEHTAFKWFKFGQFPSNLHSPIKILA